MASFVITASVYADNINTPAEATSRVDRVNEVLLSYGVQIRLPDNAYTTKPDPRESHWELSGLTAGEQ